MLFRISPCAKVCHFDSHRLQRCALFHPSNCTMILRNSRSSTESDYSKPSPWTQLYIRRSWCILTAVVVTNFSIRGGSSKKVINTYCLNRSFNVISRSVPSGATSEIRLRACGLRCTTAFSKSFILVSRSPVELFVAVDPSLWWPSLSPAWFSRRRNAISGSDMIVSCLLRLLVLIYTAPR